MHKKKTDFLQKPKASSVITSQAPVCTKLFSNSLFRQKPVEPGSARAGASAERPNTAPGYPLIQFIFRNGIEM